MEEKKQERKPDSTKRDKIIGTGFTSIAFIGFSSWLNALLKKGESHPIEKTGAKLRAMMPWMKKHSIKGAQAAY